MSARSARTGFAPGGFGQRPPRPYCLCMAAAEDVERIAGAAATFASPGEELRGVLVAETLGRRVYLCAFESAGAHAWLAMGDDAQPLTDGRLVREAASLAALCEVAEDSA